MAITIFKTPNIYEGAYSPFLPFGLTSSGSDNDNFRYTLELYTGDEWWDFNLYTLLTTVKIPPRNNGVGLYSPTKILQSTLKAKYNNEFGVDPFVVGTPKNVDNAFTGYYFKIYEESTGGYYFDILQNNFGSNTFDLFFRVGSGPNPDNVADFDIQVGDILDIEKVNNLSNADISGTQSVNSITTVTLIPSGGTLGTYSKVTFDGVAYNFGTLGTFNERGYIRNIKRNTITTATYGVTNFVNGHEEYEQDRLAEYSLTYSNSKFLTEYDFGTKKVYRDDYETIDFNLTINDPIWYDFYNNGRYIVNGYDINNNKIYTATQSYNNLSFEDTPRKFVGIGPANLGLSSSSIKYYDFVLQGLTSSWGDISETKRYEVINDSCREYEVIRLQFLNKLGGYDYWNFDLVSKYKSNIDRTTIQKNLDYDYAVSDRGEKVISDMIEEEWEINTNWLNDDEALFIRELVESPDVYLVVQGQPPLKSSSINGNYKLPIIITDSSYDYKSTLNDMQIQYTIKFVKSYKIRNNV